MTSTTVSTHRPSAARALQANAVYTAAGAVVLLAASGPLAGRLDLPRWLLFVLGIDLLVSAPLVWMLASRRPIRRPDLLGAFWVDVSWSIGAAILIAWPGLLSPAAALTLALVSVPVVALAVWEWQARPDAA